MAENRHARLECLRSRLPLRARAQQCCRDPTEHIMRTVVSLLPGRRSKIYSVELWDSRGEAGIGGHSGSPPGSNTATAEAPHVGAFWVKFRKETPGKHCTRVCVCVWV